MTDKERITALEARIAALEARLAVAEQRGGASTDRWQPCPQWSYPTTLPYTVTCTSGTDYVDMDKMRLLTQQSLAHGCLS